MTIMGEAPNGERREQLERRAAVVRARLEERLQLLEQRRDGLVNRIRTVTTPPLSVFILGGVAICAAAWLVYRARRPRRLALPSGVLVAAPTALKSKPLVTRLLQKALISIGIALLRRLSTASMNRLLATSAPLPERQALVIPRPR